jgi:DNA-binding NarL/FixJ family response regulator
MQGKDGQLCAAVITGGDPEQTVAVVSDRRLSLAALASLLIASDSREILTVVRGAEEVQEALDASRPPVVIADGNWNSGPQINTSAWDGRVLFLLDPDAPIPGGRASRPTANGYLSRSASAEALEVAIDSVRQLGRYIDPMLAAKLAAATEANPEPAQSPLSERELQILAAIARGKSSKEIARECSVSPKTICNHVSNIYAKLNLNHRGQLVLYAAEMGLTQPYPALTQSLS